MKRKQKEYLTQFIYCMFAMNIIWTHSIVEGFSNILITKAVVLMFLFYSLYCAVKFQITED